MPKVRRLRVWRPFPDGSSRHGDGHREAGGGGSIAHLSVCPHGHEAQEAAAVQRFSSHHALQDAARGVLRQHSLTHELHHLIRTANLDDLLAQSGGCGTSGLSVAIEAVAHQRRIAHSPRDFPGDTAGGTGGGHGSVGGQDDHPHGVVVAGISDFLVLPVLPRLAGLRGEQVFLVESMLQRELLRTGAYQQDVRRLLEHLAGYRHRMLDVA